MMTRIISTLSVLTVMTCLLILNVSAFAAEPHENTEQAQFMLPIPDGWRTETIPFPLEFAPELQYTGIEELRFSPGMFDPSSEQFWTYAFIWWVPDSTLINADRLSADLENYFSGLSKSVSAGNGVDISGAIFQANFVARPATTDQGVRFSGQVNTLDVFVTNQPVSLNVAVSDIACPEQGQKALFFEFSPQPQTHQVWTSLADIRTGFRCSN